MRALQLHYTSCRRGLGSGPGFQVRALTPGIQPEEQREIERRGVYRPPRVAPPAPTDDEISRDFPSALRYYPLSSGRWALTLASYAGRDYSGRWGNFFAHTLVLESALSQIWPIDLYEWDGWKRRLLPDEDTDQPPLPLPAVDLEGLVPAESFDLPELKAFLTEEPGRQDLLARMGDAALAAASSSRAVVVRDSPLNGLFWIACIQKLFPPSHAQGLSFATFQDDPRGCVTVNGTLEGTDFTFNDAERRYRFSMFDLLTGGHSEVEPEARYPVVAARWLAEEPGRLGAFFDFMSQLDHHRLDGVDLDAAVDLFELVDGGGESVDGQRMAAMLDFAGRHSPSAGRAVLLEQLGSVLLTGPSLPEPGDYSAAVSFLATGAQATGEPSHRALAFDLWRRLWLQDLVGRGRGSDTVRESWRAMHQVLPAHSIELARRFLDRRIVELAAERAAELSPAACTLTLELSGEALARLGRRPVWEQPEIRLLVLAWTAATADPEVASDAVLAAIPDQPSALVGAVHLLLEPAPAASGPVDRGCAVGRALGRRLSKLAPGQAAAVRRELDTPASWDVLFGEWLVLSAESDDLGRCFDDYRAVLDLLPGYRASCGPRIYTSLLERLPAVQRASKAAEWVRGGDVRGFSPELRRACIELANEALARAEGAEGDRLASLLGELAAENDIVLRPDRPLLHRLAEQAGCPTSPGDLARLAAALEGAHQEEYETFLEAFLLPGLGRVASRDAHGRLLRAAWIDLQRSSFLKVYTRFLRAQRGRDGLAALQAALKFWLFLEPAVVEEPLAGLRESVFDQLVRSLSRLPGRRLSSLRERLDRARLVGEPLRRWREIDERVSRESQGVLGRWRRRFSRS